MLLLMLTLCETYNQHIIRTDGKGTDISNSRNA